MTLHDTSSPDSSTAKFDRRALLVGAGAAAVGFMGCPAAQNLITPVKNSSVFVASGQRYDGPLEQTIRDGLLATGLDPALLRGAKVLLKPNMVEPLRNSPHMTTNPAMVLATAEVFRRWDAKVVVGEAPGHVRDTEWALHESRIGPALEDGKLEFADLNYEEVAWTPNAGRLCKLPGFYFPRAVAEADVVVSMPKLKTHHWVGVTISLKNLYGTLPGCKYGWPKNVLHHAGIPETVIDINASLPKTIAVVDAIDCMEGDGPIMGSLKHMGLVAVGTNLTAVDATCARIMGIEPSRVRYLSLADGRLGPLDSRYIEQRGEDWKKLVSPFTVLDRPELKAILATPAELTS